jgi:hypothetical protein
MVRAFLYRNVLTLFHPLTAKALFMNRVLNILLCLVFSFSLRAQSSGKNDVITKLNGDELSGKVMEISDTEIKFSYSGETLVYTFKKTDIQKITYASGRTETFNKSAPPEARTDPPSTGKIESVEKSAVDHQNRVAILPFSYVTDGQNAADALSEKAQSACYSYLIKNAGSRKILDPRTTNAQLYKAGVHKDNMKGHTMDDICNILGVEYVVEGVVTMNKSGVSSQQSKTTDKSNDGSKQTSVHGTAEQEYETTVLLSVYNDKGSSVFNQDRKSILSGQGAYKNTLEYLLKRSPLYSK